jgi:hypothetical protein
VHSIGRWGGALGPIGDRALHSLHIVIKLLVGSASQADLLAVHFLLCHQTWKPEGDLGKNHDEGHHQESYAQERH